VISTEEIPVYIPVYIPPAEEFWRRVNCAFWPCAQSIQTNIRTQNMAQLRPVH